MSLHDELKQRIFQAGLDASKRKFSQDEARELYANFTNSAVSTSSFDPEAPYDDHDSKAVADHLTAREIKTRLDSLPLASRMIDALDHFQGGLESSFSYGLEVTKFLQLAVSHQTLSSLGLTGTDLDPLKASMEYAASRLEIARLLHESWLAKSPIKPAFDDGFRLAFNDERPISEQLVKAIPDRENEYWVLEAQGDFTIVPDVNAEIWSFSAISYKDGEKHSVSSGKRTTLAVALFDYPSLAPPEPEGFSSPSP